MDTTRDSERASGDVDQSDRPPSPTSPSTSATHFLLLVFLLHGIGALLPWNMLIDAVSYFEYKLNASRNASNDIEENLFSYISIASKLPNIVLQVFNIVFTLSLPSQYSSGTRVGSSLSTRIQISLMVQIVIFLALIMFVRIDTATWPAEIVFIVIMLAAVLLNMANGIYQSCIYGVAARFPVLRYTNAITGGMSLSGTVTSLLDIGSIAVSPSPETETQVFFSIAALILFICLVAEMSYYRFMNAYKLPQSESRQSLLRDEIADQIESSEEESGISIDTPWWQLHLSTLGDIWPHLVNILLVYFVTFSLFPAVLGNIQPQLRPFHPDQSSLFIPVVYFTPVVCFFALNSCTTLGNYLAEWLPLGNRPRVIALLSIARLLFIPFFLYCNYTPPTAHREHLPVVVRSDWLYLAGVMALAISAGYLSSLCMMYAPKSVRARSELEAESEQYQRRVETAGMVSALTVIVGILVGVNSSLIYPILI